MKLEQVALILIAIWLTLLSAGVIWIISHLLRITKNVKTGNLVNILEEVLATEGKNTKSIKKLESELRVVDKKVELHIQKVGLIRFNPFSELGGDQSFTLALLNAEDTGILLTGLHTRERTRVYIKDINLGKSKHSLSNEEKKVLAKAMNISYAKA